jgi:hypothetical protein
MLVITSQLMSWLATQQQIRHAQDEAQPHHTPARHGTTQRSRIQHCHFAHSMTRMKHSSTTHLRAANTAQRSILVAWPAGQEQIDVF